MPMFEIKLDVMVTCPATATVTVHAESIEVIKRDLGDILNKMDENKATAVNWSINDDDINPENWDAEVEEWKELPEE